MTGGIKGLPFEDYPEVPLLPANYLEEFGRISDLRTRRTKFLDGCRRVPIQEIPSGVLTVLVELILGNRVLIKESGLSWAVVDTPGSVNWLAFKDRHGISVTPSGWDEGGIQDLPLFQYPEGTVWRATGGLASKGAVWYADSFEAAFKGLVVFLHFGPLVVVPEALQPLWDHDR